MKKTIYIARHGQTDYNKADLVQGRAIDAHLNDYGQAQGDAMSEALMKVSFDKIYTSSLQRTWETARLLLEKGYPTEAVEGLDELHYGVYENTPINQEGDNVWNVMNQWIEGNPKAKAEGGESPVEVQNRQKEALEGILAEPNEQTILLVMHSRAIRILMCTLLKKPLTEMHTFTPKNTGITKFSYDTVSKTFELIEFNNTEHLEGLAPQ
ncbi:histidine phosphatase family protein [Persicobacter psychrovividus]|uniref:Phosphoglycerate mutase n=1 Tax=Persicobacter psychrovividus TaxID=387638 RepID=A0ABM7VCG5_9BACT|nr:phosphoglycerate mutase [Persicobacter psychrovividus]